MEENEYKHHFEMLDRYQAFSAEVLRLSLASIAGFGFFLGIEHGEGQRIAHAIANTLAARWMVTLGLAALVSASAFSLIHRYVSADAMYYILKGNLAPLEDEDRSARNTQFHRSTIAIAAAPIALALGVSLLAGAFLDAW